MKIHSLAIASSCLAILFQGCAPGPNDTRLEFAPQMYHSIPFEPFTQVIDSTSEFYNTIKVNPNGQNMRKPVNGTIARKQYSGMVKGAIAEKLFISEIPADSLDYAAKVLTSPLLPTPEVIAEGKVLYGRYCQACHGEGGMGDGKVADQYKGVANLVAKAKVVSDGHIYHVITHGKGRMWPHGSQVNPDERWKIVHFVKSLASTPAQ